MFKAASPRRARRLGSGSRLAACNVAAKPQLSIEPLEPRHLLSAAGFDVDLLDHDHVPPGRTIAQAKIEQHWINGRPFTFVADPAAPSGSAVVDAQAIAGDSLLPLTSIPVLHSDPNAPVKIYLDFDGHFEAQWGSYTNVVTPVYDRDGDATTFSGAELNFIEMAWKKVTEDFSPFNIDVTTEEPPQLAPGVPESAANGLAMRVSIGGNSGWTGGVYGGLAYHNLFTNSIANVVYVFSESTGNGQWDGDVSSHEAGHGFGLGHQSLYDDQGNLINTYHPGDGTWAPIMGNTYIPVTTWHNGTSSSATTFQDDLDTIARSANGFGYRADDHGDTLGAATQLVFDGQRFSGSGLVGSNGDLDVWSFSVLTTDTYRVAVDPAAVGPNLDARLELRDAAGALLGAVSPVASQAAELILNLSPASYFVSVAKTATYGWVGAYEVSVTTPPPAIVVTAHQTLVTREGGPGAEFAVVLQTQPTADVIVPLSSSDPAEGDVSTPNLIFTAANWNVPQRVTVSGLDDGARDADRSYSIVLGPASSADPEYAGLDAADLAAVNLDNSHVGYLLWADPTNDVIKRSTLHGADQQTLINLPGLFGGSGVNYEPRYVALDASAGKMYWTDSAAGRIQRANLDGSNVETLVSGFTGAGLRGIALDSAAGKMYWTDFGAQKIQRSNLNGSQVEDLVTSAVNGARELALDLISGLMYWADYGTRSVRRANLNGTNVEVLWSGAGLERPSGLALDLAAGKLYWSDQGLDKVWRANLDGSAAEVLIDLQDYFLGATPASLAVDAAGGKLYIADLNNQALFRANLDGSGFVAVATGGIAPQGLALLSPSVTVTPSSGLISNESGLSAQFQVVLTTPPTADVSIPISTSDPGEGAATVASLTFTAANWNVPQTVTVVGADDAQSDGDAPYSILLGPIVSADGSYAGIDPRDVSLLNIDNEVKFYVVDDASSNRSYKYAADGTARGNTTLGSSNSAPRGVASTIVGDKTWVVDANRNVYVYSTSSGALLGSWAAGALAKNATVEGIAANGTDVWIVDARSDRVYRYAGAAGRLSGTQNALSSFSLNSGNRDAKDIVTDGQSFWVVNNSTSDRVFKYSLAGVLQGSWAIDSANKSPTGIAIDPANLSHIWIVDSGTDRVYQYNAAATRTSGSQAAAVTFALAAGNANPQGIADPPAAALIIDVAAAVVPSLGSYRPVGENLLRAVGFSTLGRDAENRSAFNSATGALVKLELAQNREMASDQRASELARELAFQWLDRQQTPWSTAEGLTPKVARSHRSQNDEIDGARADDSLESTFDAALTERD